MVSVSNCGLIPRASTICLILSALKSMNTSVSLSGEEGEGGGGEGGRREGERRGEGGGEEGQRRGRGGGGRGGGGRGKRWRGNIRYELLFRRQSIRTKMITTRSKFKVVHELIFAVT